MSNMKVVIFLLFAVAAVMSYPAIDEKTSVQIPGVVCPPYNGLYPTLLPNPVDCNSYYVCDRGHPIPMKCPPNLHFNAKENVCDFPFNAGCQPEA